MSGRQEFVLDMHNFMFEALSDCLLRIGTKGLVKEAMMLILRKIFRQIA